MLSRRILTALLLVPVTVTAVLWLPSPGFALFSGAVVLLGFLEWNRLVPFEAVPMRILFVFLGALFLFALWSSRGDRQLVQLVSAGAALWWLASLAWILSPGWSGGRNPLLKFAAAFIALGPPWLGLVALQGRAGHGPELALFLLVLVWTADSSAYFTGRWLGRRRLAPAVSPGKTWEGVVGGLAGAAAVSMVGAWHFGWRDERWIQFVSVGVTAAALSVVGDLFVSLLKRQQHLKDTSHLLPGHGGILDRIDSLLAAVPWALSWWLWLGLVVL
ncbi:MAG: phosphatidate cytidylyltransferase [Gammaproteobacteria bacterium]|nr:MAG: phosphatidate cytidylyltransferase [Gammaproteobacteria bacterium]